jgi:hypothetical protein
MKHPPYHLRTNKAVDRLLFVDILRHANPPGQSFRDFRYISLSGPFLEDLRVMDHFFPEMQLISLEKSQQTYKRQLFHKFNSSLDVRWRTLSDFLIHDYQPGIIDVFWLDFTDLSYTRFEEFQSVLTKVPPGSIVRITLRAEPEIDIRTLTEQLPEEYLARMRNELERKFRDEFVKVLSHATVTGAFINPPEFARMVQLMIKRTASIALDYSGSKVDYLPIQSACYNDGTFMLSVTGIVYPRRQKRKTQKTFEKVKFVDFDWGKPVSIDIPALSMKERLFLEHMLPVAPGQIVGEELLQALGYMIDDGKRKTIQQLAHYADYCRDYPNFVRILA